MKIFLKYSITYADDPESNIEGHFYSPGEVREMMGPKVATLVEDYFSFPYALKLVYFPEDLTKYELSFGQSLQE